VFSGWFSLGDLGVLSGAGVRIGLLVFREEERCGGFCG
jgi:hypothetical protein